MPAKCCSDIENYPGARALKSERYDDAERFLRSALQRARALQSPYPEASVLVNLGLIPLQPAPLR